MKTLTRIIASLALTAVLAAVSFAQDDQGGPPQGGPGMGRRPGGPGMGGPPALDRLPSLAQLAGRPEVAKELGLSDDQVGQLRTIAMSIRQGMRPPQPGGDNDGPPDPMAMRAARDKAEADADAKAKTILTAPQAKRLAEIQVQSMGLTAALVPSVQAKLKLTDDQKAQLKALVPARGQGGPGGMGGPPPGGGMGGDRGGPPDMQGGQGGPPDMQGAGPGMGEPGGMGGPSGGMAARRKELEKGIAAILTDDQKASLKTLGGKPIKLSPPRGMGGPGGPGGPGGFGGGPNRDPR